jgi:hypothetical protein
LHHTHLRADPHADIGKPGDTLRVAVNVGDFTALIATEVFQGDHGFGHSQGGVTMNVANEIQSQKSYSGTADLSTRKSAIS